MCIIFCCFCCCYFLLSCVLTGHVFFGLVKIGMVFFFVCFFFFSKLDNTNNYMHGQSGKPSTAQWHCPCCKYRRTLMGPLNDSDTPPPATSANQLFPDRHPPGFDGLVMSAKTMPRERTLRTVIKFLVSFLWPSRVPQNNILDVSVSRMVWPLEPSSQQ